MRHMIVRRAVRGQVERVGLGRDGRVGDGPHRELGRPTDERRGSSRVLRVGRGGRLLLEQGAVDVLVAHRRRLELAGHS